VDCLDDGCGTGVLNLLVPCELEGELRSQSIDQVIGLEVDVLALILFAGVPLDQLKTL